jgi:hypothetical protein
VYWRLTRRYQNQFNSAMPLGGPTDAPNADGAQLRPDAEAWQVIAYLYKATGFEPRQESEAVDHRGH